MYLCRIPRLDLGVQTPKSVTWRSLGAVGRLVADTATQTGDGAWEVILHLSGGYKAMIPYLMVLAEGVHSRLRPRAVGPQYRPKVRAVAIHDPSEGRNPNQARNVVDIPVRAINSVLLAGVAKLAAMPRAGSDPDSDPDNDIVVGHAPEDLLGLFIEPADQRQSYRLTAAGLIMVNVL